MPTYVYRCRECKEEGDHRLPVEHEKPSHCGVEMQRVFTPFSFAFKVSTFDKVTGGLEAAQNMSPAYKEMAMSGFDKKRIQW